MEGDEQVECVALALRLAEEAGALIREAFYEAQSPAFELKAENDHVTATDLACEQLILDGLCAELLGPTVRMQPEPRPVRAGDELPAGAQRRQSLEAER